MKEHRRIDKTDEANREHVIRQNQMIQTLNESFNKIDEFLKTNEPRMGQGKRPSEVKSNITDNDSAKMTTSKGTIQGYNGVATVDKKHQVIIDVQAFGHGQEHHTLQPVLEKVKSRFAQLKVRKDLFKSNIIITADTGFSNESNNEYLHKNTINGYIPDNAFRSRDPKFAEQKEKYGELEPESGKSTKEKIIPSSEFQFDPIILTYICSIGEKLTSLTINENRIGRSRAEFRARVSKCRVCPLKKSCLKHPEKLEASGAMGRQVAFIIDDGRPGHTDWMKERIDSDLGREIYSHRMSVVEPVFADIGTNKGLRRFSLRGKAKVQDQWQLYCTVHKIEKWMNYGKMAA